MKKLIVLTAAALWASSALAQNEAAPASATPASAPADATGPGVETPATAGKPAAATPAASDGEKKPSAEIKIGTDIANRDIVGEADSFTADTPKLAAWTRIAGFNQPTTVWHVWKRNGEEVSKVSLNVTSSYFRTYSRKDVNGAAGNWTLEVRDAEGNVIGSKDFTVGDTTAK